MSSVGTVHLYKPGLANIQNAQLQPLSHSALARPVMRSLHPWNHTEWYSPRFMRWVAAYVVRVRICTSHSIRVYRLPADHSWHPVCVIVVTSLRLLLHLPVATKKMLYHCQSCLFRHRTFCFERRASPTLAGHLSLCGEIMA